MQTQKQREEAEKKLVVPQSPQSKMKEKMQGKKSEKLEVGSMQPMLDSLKRIKDMSRNYFKTLYNQPGYTGDTKGEINTMPNMTVPEMAMSIREIYDRYAHGLPVNAVTRVPLYEGDEPTPDLKRMDLTEIAEYRDKIRKELKEIQDRRYKLIKAQQYQQIEKEIKEKQRLEAEKQKQEEPKPNNPE